jgi:hypothetical protein
MAAEWMEDAERIAVAGYRQVLEEGPDKCDSESAAEDSDHWQKCRDEEMCTPDIMDEKGKPVLSRARLATEQEKALRAAGMAGGLVTVRAPE